MWSFNYSLLPVGAAKENKTEIFEITALTFALCLTFKLFLVSFPTCVSVSCSVGTYFDVDQGRCALCPAGTYQDEEAQMSCEVCPGPEGREVSKVVGARNMSECGGKTAKSIVFM